MPLNTLYISEDCDNINNSVKDPSYTRKKIIRTEKKYTTEM